MPNFKVSQSGMPVKTPRTTKKQESREVTESKKIYRLVGDREPETQLIKTSAAWGIDSKGNRRLMRLAVGATSVWVDEQMQSGESALKVMPLSIENGRLILNKAREPLTIEFLDCHEKNAKNGGELFYEYNAQEVSEKNVASEEQVLDAKIFIREKLRENDGFNKVLNIGLAMKLAVRPSYSETQLKEAMFAACETDPIGIMNAFDDPFIKAMSYIESASAKGELIYNGSAIKWAAGGEIMKVPQGRPWKEYLSEYATQLENLDFLKELEKIYNG